MVPHPNSRSHHSKAIYPLIHAQVHITSHLTCVTESQTVDQWFGRHRDRVALIPPFERSSFKMFPCFPTALIASISLSCGAVNADCYRINAGRARRTGRVGRIRSPSCDFFLFVLDPTPLNVLAA